MKVRRDVIRCPVCELVQEGEVWVPDPPTAIFPFPAYSHYCRGCDYLILESEWDVVVPPPAGEGPPDPPFVVAREDDGDPD